MAKFGCAITCIDGRTMESVTRHLMEQYRLDYVDLITEPGVNKILAESNGGWFSGNKTTREIRKKVEISLTGHGARIIAIVGHANCLANPADKEEQIEHLKKAHQTIDRFGFWIDTIALWVPEGWKTVELITG